MMKDPEEQDLREPWANKQDEISQKMPMTETMRMGLLLLSVVLGCAAVQRELGPAVKRLMRRPEEEEKKVAATRPTLLKTGTTPPAKPRPVKLGQLLLQEGRGVEPRYPTVQIPVKDGFMRTMRDLVKKGVSAVTCDDPRAIGYQGAAVRHVRCPVFLSPLIVLPSVICAYGDEDVVAVLSMDDPPAVKDRLRHFYWSTCRIAPVEPDEDTEGHVVIVRVNEPSEALTAVREAIHREPRLRCVVVEDPRLARNSDTLRTELAVSVFDWHNVAETVLRGFLANRGGWQQPNAVDRLRGGSSSPRLGIIRLDYHYEMSPGEVDHPASFKCPVDYLKVDGLSFEMCQSGVMTEEVERNFIQAVDAFDQNDDITVIGGDCGFMMYFQRLARQRTSKPVCMSALSILPTLVGIVGGRIAIFTANSNSLTPLRAVVKAECGLDPEDPRFVIVGCQDVPGFEAVARAEKVDADRVTPGMVAKARATLDACPDITAFLFECTELPPFSDAVRHATGLPVYDTITTLEAFIEGFPINHHGVLRPAPS